MASTRASCLLLLYVAGALGIPSPPLSTATPDTQDIPETPENPETPQFPNPEPRIVGGLGVNPGELPYMVSIQDTRWGTVSHFCGGAVYDQSHVVTAAHCVSSIDVSKIQVVAGENDLSVVEGHEQTLLVESIFIHPQFNEFYYYNDIAILKVQGKFVFNEYVQPVQMPSGKEAAGTCVVSGWGATEENGDAINLLKKASVPVWLDEDCRQVYGNEEVLDSMVCAGLEEGGKDACHKDSGSPLMCSASGSHAFFAGVMSWGLGCARPSTPSVYTEVSHFSDWLGSHIY